ncbi:PD-(D/E)XK nuclease family protein [Prosthecochloris vibrioformis]|uniref:PD-(D/E)XK nuclease family protein n=1 Tax=Prosthecochloris vibrioformis TaxID=1098 RepID=A0A5C4S0C6_PROVB|nr:PD-(D/E)XK nuclease family protein [Prosthecochloris vibrioformis]TNJ36966.1 PD-(D/E)XK nuclease family protein [Prosthecochloris vibrioformis]
MHILLGLHLDGERSWKKRHALGHLELGPSGFLSQLEQYLGLSANRSSKLQRVILFRHILAELDDGKRFYSKTMRVDQLGAASALLGWRDELYLCGWSGTFERESASPRLRDMMAIEEALKDRGFPPGNGERLLAVSAALDRLRTPVSSLTLVEQLERYPLRWREVIRKLPYTLADHFSGVQAPEGSRLAVLQERILSGRLPSPGERWQDDGSVVLLSADTALEAAYLTAGVLEGGYSDLLLMLGGERSLLDDVLSSRGLPRQAIGDGAAGRPVMQLLVLSLRLHARPLDVFALQEFLMLPSHLNPLPDGLGWCLAAAVSVAPGIGGERWCRALSGYVKENGLEQQDVERQLAAWLEVVSPAEAALRVLRFFERKVDMVAEPELKNAFTAGLEQVGGFIDAMTALEEQGVERLSDAELRHLLLAAEERVQRRPLSVRQAGSVPDAGHPGAICEPFSHVLWWWAAAPPPHQGMTWSAGERQFLEGEGVALPTRDEQRRWYAEELFRPVLAATERVTVVLPSKGEEMHPVCTEIFLLFPDMVSSGTVLGITGGTPGSIPVEYRGLADKRACWKLCAPLPKAARPFSATSLELLLSDPASWVMQHLLLLRPSGVQGISDGPRLYGQLSHRLVQRLCQKLERGGADDGMDEWFAQEFSHLVAHEGALLLMPGRGGEYQKLRYRLKSAVDALLPVLLQFGASRVESEYYMKGGIGSEELAGIADLLLFDAAGRPLVIDMKWGGAEQRRKSLDAGRHVQLLVYASLVFQEKGRWPDLAYYILSKGEMLVPHAPAASASPEKLWERLQMTYEYRVSRLAAGELCSALNSDAGECDGDLPEQALLPLPRESRFNPYRYLHGW